MHRPRESGLTDEAIFGDPTVPDLTTPLSERTPAMSCGTVLRWLAVWLALAVLIAILPGLAMAQAVADVPTLSVSPGSRR